MIKFSKTHYLKNSLIVNRFTVLFVFISIFIFLESCEGYRCAEGTVVDKSTNHPLDSVLVEVKKGSQSMYTDTTGKFDVCNPFAGCVPKCKDIMVTFSKSGYKSIIIINPGRKEIVYMEE